MEVKVCVGRWGGWEFRTVDIDIEDIVKKELNDQVGGIGGIDIELDGFDIEGIKASTINFELY